MELSILIYKYGELYRMEDLLVASVLFKDLKDYGCSNKLALFDKSGRLTYIDKDL